MISFCPRKWMFVIALFSITSIAVMLILQVVYSSLDRQYASTLAIEIMPSFQIKIEWLHLSVVVLYTAGLVITSTTYIHWYFVPLAVFISIQWMYTTYGLLDREAYIMDQLRISWQAAYNDNLPILENIQNTWHCQGFSTILDRPAYTLTENETNMTACYPILSETFGSTVFVWGIGLWVVKVIQIIGLWACYTLYIHVHNDFKQNDEERGPIQLPEEDVDPEDYTTDDDEDDDDDDVATIVVVVPTTAVNEKLPLQDEKGTYLFQTRQHE